MASKLRQSEVGHKNKPMNAIAHRAKIIEVGRMCRSVSDQLSESDVENSGWLTALVNVIDVTFQWLEHEIPNVNINSTKTEHILRALYNVTELGNNAQIFPILKMTFAFLNNEKDPFKEERQRILNCLEKVEKRQATLESLINEACRLLKEMLNSEEVDYAKQREFDNVVRKANVEIDFCSRRLNGAEKLLTSSLRNGTSLNGCHVVCVLQAIASLSMSSTSNMKNQVSHHGTC
ncbi:uncharacterized protein LOC124433971 [Xenia sp. Carnegie-2017]|uniref:uncharacterized protein LOC124433971 n=1 Tax=Xenia sp. Carnegie-2017 TaxID=2897299 RepID=UPI001F04D7E9|nr:uncharacterized protein LOC124433971 [Xenia sp. Carnegie-2017]